jgi:hypothetical protein
MADFIPSRDELGIPRKAGHFSGDAAHPGDGLAATREHERHAGRFEAREHQDHG